MSVRYYDTKQQRWGTTTVNIWSPEKNDWIPAPEVPQPNLWPGGMFDPYIGKGTIWQRPASEMKISSKSDDYAKWFASHLTYDGFPGSGMSFNNSLWGTPPIPVYVVDSSLPGMTYQTVDKVHRVDDAYAVNYLTGEIPWPVGALPVTYQDHSIAIWDRATGIMREYFYMAEVSPGHWESSSAGISIAKPFFEDMDKTNYATQLISGSSSVVGMHNELGFVGISELMDTSFDSNGLIQDNKIAHALAFTTSSFSVYGPSWPAFQSDGRVADVNAPREGQWARVKSSVDPHYNPLTGKPYNMATQALIVAAQDYGMVGTDQNGAIDAFNGENGSYWKLLHGQDPWERVSTTDMSLNGMILQKYANNPNVSFSVSDFPMAETEWAEIDFGRPQVDFFPGYEQVGIYVDPAVQ